MECCLDNSLIWTKEVPRNAKTAYSGNEGALRKKSTLDSGFYKRQPKQIAVRYAPSLEHKKQWTAILVVHQSLSSTEEEFNQLASKWKHETRHFSITVRRYANPAYKAILAKKEKAVPFILKELRRDPDRWFDALEEITKENPAKDASTFYEAVDCWVSWGIANGHLA